jgi:hypothetical protein
MKIIEKWVEAGLPKPAYKYETSGLWVIFNNDIYTSDYLKSLDLNDRQIKAITLLLTISLIVLRVVLDTFPQSIQK